MKLFTRLITVTAICISFLQFPFWAVGVEQPRDIRAVLDGMKRFADAFNAIPSWKIEFSQHRNFITLPPGFSDRMPYGEYVVAKKGKLFYVQRTLKGTPPHVTWTAWKDGVSTNRVNGGDYHIVPEFHVNFLELSFYTQYLFIDIYKEHKSRTPSIADVLGAKSFSEAFWLRLPEGIDGNLKEWSLRPGSEDIQGANCVVLERLVDGKRRDILWVDTEHGYVCRKRQYFEAPGRILAEWRNDDLKVAIPGLFLPHRQEVTVYNGNHGPQELLGKKRTVYTNTLSKISLDEIPDDFFVAPMITEGQVVDMVQKQSYIIRPGADNPETRIRQALGDGGVGKLTSESPPKSNFRYRIVIWNVVGLLGIVLAFQLQQLYSRRPKK